MSAAPAPVGGTPILDRLKPLPPQVTSTGPSGTVSFVLWVAYGVVIFLFMTAYPEVASGLAKWFLARIRSGLPDVMTGAAVLRLIFTALAVLFVAIVIHEAGHAIVGTLLGFHVSSIRVSRVQVDLPFKFSIYRGTGTGAGGWVTLLPVKRDKLALRTAAMLAAGPLANLASAAAVDPLPISKGFGLRLFVIVSVALGLINLLPFRSRAMLSDGRRILMLLSNRARGERWLAILRLVGDMGNGTPPESFSREDLALAVAVLDNTGDTVMAHALAYASAFHRHDDEEAGRMLETALQYAGYAAPIMREGLMTDAAVFQGRRRRRADLAEAWRASLPDKPEIAWLTLLADAAVLDARDDVPGTLAVLERAHEQISGESNKLRREVSLRSLERWQSDLKARAAIS